MDAVRQWAMAVCVTMAGAALFSMLVPNGNMKKVVSFAINLFFISSLVSPLLVNPPEFNFDVIDSQTVHSSQRDDLEATIQDQMRTLSERNLEQTVQQLLKTIEVESEKIEIIVNIDETNSISISKLTLWLTKDDRSKQDEIDTLLKQQMGITPEIVYSE